LAAPPSGACLWHGFSNGAPSLRRIARRRSPTVAPESRLCTGAAGTAKLCGRWAFWCYARVSKASRCAFASTAEAAGSVSAEPLWKGNGFCRGDVTTCTPCRSRHSHFLRVCPARWPSSNDPRSVCGSCVCPACLGQPQDEASEGCWEGAAGGPRASWAGGRQGRTDAVVSGSSMM
jgi:hypothetical protein